MSLGPCNQGNHGRRRRLLPGSRDLVTVLHWYLHCIRLVLLFLPGAEATAAVCHLPIYVHCAFSNLKCGAVFWIWLFLLHLVGWQSCPGGGHAPYVMQGYCK